MSNSSSLKMTEISPVTKKLAKISEIMADGYHFVKMRFLCEQWEAEALAGDENSAEMIKIIDTMHRLCLAVERNK